MQISNIISINVNKLLAVLTNKYGITGTSKFDKVNIDLSAMSMPSYTGKAWLVGNEFIANLSMPKALMRETVKFESYALNLVFGVIKALFDAKSKDFEKEAVISAIDKLGVRVVKNAQGIRSLSGVLPDDILEAIDVPPVWKPKKTKGSKQVKFSCCGNSIYIPDGVNKSAASIAGLITCDLCGKSFNKDSDNRLPVRIQESLLNA
jgi:hypothetical protein